MRATVINIITLLLLITACGKDTDDPDNNVFITNKTAQWINDVRQLPSSDSLFYLDRPAPQFRKEFKTESRIENARLYITAAGYYKASINGKGVEGNILDPAWTNYSKRIYYSEFDVTSLLKDGINCLGVSLGNGFYFIRDS